MTVKFHSKIDGKMFCRYNSEKDLHDRLNGTIVFYDDEPFLVNGVHKKTLYLGDMVSGDTLREVPSNDERLDISSPELGYMNLEHREFGNVVLYIVRVPYKRYKQGICPQNLEVLNIHGDGISYHVGNYFNSHGFKSSLRNEFPSLVEAMSKLEKGKEVAISKSIAIKRSTAGVILVYYRCKEVGWLAPNTDIVNVPNNEMGWLVDRYLSELAWRVKVA